MLDGIGDAIPEHTRWLEADVFPLTDLKHRLAAARKAISSPPVVYESHEGAFVLPLAISQSRWDAWAQASVTFIDLVWRHVNGFMAREGAAFLRRIGVDAALAGRLDRTPPVATSESLMARPDFFLGADGPLFLETNIDSSLGGLGTADPLTRLYQDHGLAQGLVPLWAVPTFAKQFRGLTKRPEPRVLVVDWQDEIDDVPWPYQRLAEDLGRFGISTRIMGPEGLHQEAGRLIGPDGAYDVVYRGVTPVSRLWNVPVQDDPFGPVWAAAAAGLPLVSSLWSVAYSSKAVLPHIWEQLSKGRLSAADADFVQRHVPWACLLDRESVRPFGQGEPIALEELADRFRERLVLKSPSDGSCKNITIGRVTSAQDWTEAVRIALSRPGYSLQQYVTPPQVPTLGKTDAVETHALNIAVFIAGGEVAGSCIRGSVSDEPYISCMRGAREGTAMIIIENPI